MGELAEREVRIIGGPGKGRLQEHFFSPSGPVIFLLLVARGRYERCETYVQRLSQSSLGPRGDVFDFQGYISVGKSTRLYWGRYDNYRRSGEMTLGNRYSP